MSNLDQKITLIGAGLAGSLLALYLARRGLKVEVFEKRGDVRLENMVGASGGEGRSINLALSRRGLHALEEVGLIEEVKKSIIPMKGRCLHSISGELSFAPYGRNDTEVINSVSRNGLNALLLRALAEFPEVELHFEHRCLGYDFNTSTLSMLNTNSNQTVALHRLHVIGTDGSASALRTSMLGSGRFDFSQSYLAHSYKELTIPGKEGFQLEPNALHIWPRGGYMMIALPNLDQSFTCTLFFPHSGKKSFESLDSPAKVLELFENEFPDALSLIPDLTGEFFSNPTGNLITVKCGPWNVKDQVLLLGDSAHAIVPFYGQGMNCAFEDCTILNQIIEQQPAERINFREVFDLFSASRKADADAIADLAMDNFIEMRDTSANPKFLLKKKVEHLLEDQYPGEFISKYSMVSFHRVPYSLALKKGRAQDEILMRTCENAQSIEEIDIEALYREISAATPSNN